MNFSKYILIIIVSATACSKTEKFNPATSNLNPAADSLYTTFTEELFPADSALAISHLDSIIRKSKAHNAVKTMATGCKGVYYVHKLPARHDSGIDLLKQTINRAENRGSPIIATMFTHHLGYALFRSGDKKKGLEHLLQAHFEAESMGYEKLPNAAICLYHLGRVYFDFWNYKRTQEYTQQAIRHAQGKEALLVGANNLLGIVYTERKKYDSAREYFSQAIAWSDSAGEPIPKAVARNNMGTLLLELKKPKEAYPFLKEGHVLLQENDGNRDNRIATQLKLLEIDVIQNKIAKAEKRAQRIKQELEENKDRDLEGWGEYHERSLEIDLQKQDTSQALEHYKTLMEIKDSILKIKNENILTDIELQLRAQEHINEMKLLKSKQKIARFKNITAILITTLAALFAMYMLYRTRKRQKRERERLYLEKEQARKELNQFRDQIRAKNQRIETFKNRLQEFSQELKNPAQKQAQQETIEQLATTIILTEEDWQEFKTRFKKVYPTFFATLLSQYPSLTTSETRFLALVKLDLSVQEIAKILGILSQSVRRTRQRLMKKLNLEDYRDIPHFVHKF